MRALARTPSADMSAALLTHLDREPIDTDRARAQHADYCRTLTELGTDLTVLPALQAHPDACFVEDVCLAFREVFVACRPGAPTRQSEVASFADALPADRSVATIEAPATLDGGDVVVMGEKVFAGETRRTNAAGIAALQAILAPFGYTVTGVPLDAALHLKSAVTRIAPDTVLLNPAWIDASPFAAFRRLAVDPAEPFAANALSVGGTVLLHASHQRTAEALGGAGFTVRTIDVGELAKAEAGLTCMSVFIPPAADRAVQALGQ